MEANNRFTYRKESFIWDLMLFTSRGSISVCVCGCVCYINLYVGDGERSREAREAAFCTAIRQVDIKPSYTGTICAQNERGVMIPLDCELAQC